MQERGARSFTEFCSWAGIGRTKGYEEVKAGRLRIRKLGKKSIVTDEEGRNWLNSLPDADLVKTREAA